jgi:transcriptional regulator with XRE-family HTH domain
MTEMGVRLKSERQKLNITQRDLAKIGGVQPNAQGKYESGKRYPRADYLEKISLIGIDILYVVAGRYTPPSNLSEAATLSAIDDFKAGVSILSNAFEILVSGQGRSEKPDR